MKVILRMFFLTLSNIDIWFDVKKLTWRSYNITEPLPTIS